MPLIFAFPSVLSAGFRMPRFLKTKADFDSAHKNNERMIVGFTALWNGPSKTIAPKFQEFEGKYPTIAFFNVDVDQNIETAEAAGILVLPTFIIYINGNKIDSYSGANEEKLRALIEKFL